MHVQVSWLAFIVTLSGCLSGISLGHNGSFITMGVGALHNALGLLCLSVSVDVCVAIAQVCYAFITGGASQAALLAVVLSFLEVYVHSLWHWD